MPGLRIGYLAAPDRYVAAVANRHLVSNWMATPAIAEIATRCAHLHIPDRRNEVDALIAATALVHGLTVATRNVRDFEGTGVVVVNPWQD